MEINHSHRRSNDAVRLIVHETTLVCHPTPSGLWRCCSEEHPDRCALGLSPAGAAAHWERFERLEE